MTFSPTTVEVDKQLTKTDRENMATKQMTRADDEAHDDQADGDEAGDEDDDAAGGVGDDNGCAYDDDDNGGV